MSVFITYYQGGAVLIMYFRVECRRRCAKSETHHPNSAQATEHPRWESSEVESPCSAYLLSEDGAKRIPRFASMVFCPPILSMPIQKSEELRRTKRERVQPPIRRRTEGLGLADKHTTCQWNYKFEGTVLRRLNMTKRLSTATVYEFATLQLICHAIDPFPMFHFPSTFRLTFR